MSKRAIGGNKVDSPADDDQVRMIVAVFPTVNGSFRFVIDGDHCAPEPYPDDNLVRPLANLM